MRPKKLVVLPFLLVFVLGSLAWAADPAVKRFKDDWASAQSFADREKRKAAELGALEHLKGATSVEAAQAALGAALEVNATFESHEAALALLKAMSAEPVHAWATKEIAANKDSRARAML